jgi:diacylglycerol kinase family enzyme
MYGYVFDSFVQDGKFRSEAQRIESRLAALGIQGRQEKITILKSLTDACQKMIKRGIETLVVVGNDETVLKVLPIAVEHGIPLGLIPVGPEQRIAKSLGIPIGIDACDVLSRRIMRRIDVGRAGASFFLLDAVLPANAMVGCDEQYTVSVTDPHAAMSVANIVDPRPDAQPDDGFLTLMVRGKGQGGWMRRHDEVSYFFTQRAEVKTTRHGEQVVLDGHHIVKTPVVLSIQPKLLSIIVGRERSFR